MTGFAGILRDSRPRIVQAGAAVVCRELLERCQFVDTIDSLVTWDPTQCRLSPGRRILALVTAFVERRKALYHMPELFARIDTELLLGEGVQPEWLNDKALGRALDKLHDADARKVYSTICLRAVAAFHILVDRLHLDTTTASVHGAYEGSEDPAVVLGFSKDHRPDLPQIKMGTVVTGEGIPLATQVTDGNKADQIWDRDMTAWLSEWMSEDERRKTLLVADSALVTKENLVLLDQKGYRFISRLPNTFGEAAAARADALYGEKSRWLNLGALSEKKDAAQYRLIEMSEEIGGRPYRLLVIHSSTLSERKAKTLERRVAKEQESLEKKLRALGRETFQCEADARAAFEAFLDREKPVFFEPQAEVLEDSIQTPRPRRGRPAKREVPPPPETVFVLRLERGPVLKDRLERIRRWESTFILISNDTSRSARELFLAYKGQSAVEASFRWLKSPVHLSPIFLKTPSRIEAFGTVMMMAYLVAALVQKLLRDHMDEGEKLGIEGRKTERPTAQAALEMIGHAQVLILHPPGERPERIYVTQDRRLDRIFQLLSIPAAAFTTLPPPVNSA